MNRISVPCWLGLTLALLAGCTSTKPAGPKFPELGDSAATVITNTLSSDLLQPPLDPFVLGPGDQVDIEILGNANSRSEDTVGLDGKIYFSLLPGIDVWGLTLAQARTRLEAEYSKYVNSPRIGISLHSVGSKYVWLLGRVNRPGIYPLAGPVTLLEGLALAGGTARSTSAVTTQDIGDLRHSFVMRQGRILPVDFVRLLQEGDMSQNIYLRPDDFVYIPSSLSLEVYVLGAVQGPRTVPYSDMMTVVSAIAGVGGPIPDAYVSHVAILRGSLSQPRLIEVDYKAIIKGQAMNVALEPGDIVFVPLSPYRFITDYANLIVTTFARTWTANAGVRAVQGGQKNVGVNVSVPIANGQPVVPP